MIITISLYVEQVQEDMRKGQVALEKYIITKTLTKPPEAYPDAKNQPHVLVSLKNNFSVGSFINSLSILVLSCFNVFSGNFSRWHKD